MAGKFLIPLTNERASAPTIAVFTIFVILSTSLAIVTFQSMEERGVSSIVLESAVDVTRATASQVEGELNTALESSITAAMYDVGLVGGTREEVENYIRDYMNVHISEVNMSSPQTLRLMFRCVTRTRSRSSGCPMVASAREVTSTQASIT